MVAKRKFVLPDLFDFACTVCFFILYIIKLTAQRKSCRKADQKTINGLAFFINKPIHCYHKKTDANYVGKINALFRINLF